jgi:hypothetical protein
VRGSRIIEEQQRVVACGAEYNVISVQPERPKPFIYKGLDLVFKCLHGVNIQVLLKNARDVTV